MTATKKAQTRKAHKSAERPRAELERQAQSILDYSNIKVDFITDTIVDALTDACRHFGMPELDHSEPKEYQVKVVADLLAKMPPTFSLRDLKKPGRNDTDPTTTEQTTKPAATHGAQVVSIFLENEGVPQFVRDAVEEVLTDAGNDTQIVVHASGGGYSRRGMAELFRHAETIGLRLFGGRLMSEAQYEAYRNDPPPALRVKDLAEMITDVWQHPDCPEEIRNGIDEGSSLLFNRLNEGERSVYKTTAYIRALLEEHKAQERAE